MTAQIIIAGYIVGLWMIAVMVLLFILIKILEAHEDDNAKRDIQKAVRRRQVTDFIEGNRT